MNSINFALLNPFSLQSLRLPVPLVHDAERRQQGSAKLRPSPSIASHRRSPVSISVRQWCHCTQSSYFHSAPLSFKCVRGWKWHEHNSCNMTEYTVNVVWYVMFLVLSLLLSTTSTDTQAGCVCTDNRFDSLHASLHFSLPSTISFHVLRGESGVRSVSSLTSVDPPKSASVRGSF
jgi:hypothetical protein